jgi:hypothetical protein
MHDKKAGTNMTERNSLNKIQKNELPCRRVVVEDLLGHGCEPDNFVEV